MSGIFSVSIDLLKISCRLGANSLCDVCRTMDLNFSRPAALCGFKNTSSLSMPSADMLMSGILGGYWAGMVGWPPSQANLAVTSVHGTLNLWGFWG